MRKDPARARAQLHTNPSSRYPFHPPSVLFQKTPPTKEGETLKVLQLVNGQHSGSETRTVLVI